MNVFSLPRPLTCAAVIAAALACSCSTKYEPQLTLPPATFDRAIDAIVELHPLQAAEGLRSGHTTYGVLAEDYVNRPPTRMSQAITAQVLNELSSSGLFRRITLYDPQPDLVLTGRIEQFYEHDRRKVWTYVPFYSDKLAGLFRLNTHMSTGEVKLTMMLLKPTGKLVGTYQGRAKFDEDFTPNSEVKPGGRLNRAFSEALAQIRDEMLADGNLPKSLKTEPMVRANRPTNPRTKPRVCQCVSSNFCRRRTIWALQATTTGQPDLPQPPDIRHDKDS